MTAEEQPQVEPHPLRRQVLFWLAVLVLVVVFLSVFSSILLPFVAGMALAYLLDPLADWLERRGLGRLGATLLILVFFVIIFVVALLLLIPALINQLIAFFEQLPSLIVDIQTLLQPLLDSDLGEFLGLDADALPDQIAGFVGNGSDFLVGLLGSIWSGGMALVALFSLLIITPVVAFYLLYDWDRILRGIDNLLPRQHADTIRGLGRQMAEVISGFIRGQGLVVIILSVVYAGALVAIGLNFGLIIGLAAGLLSFIPFVGTAVGFLASVGVAAAQFIPDGDWIWVFVTAGIFIAGQILEANYLQPKLIGESVGLHPVWLIFAIFAFSLLFGFVGTLIAVPAAAIVAVLVRFGIRQYLASPYYSGGGRPPPATEGGDAA